SGALARKPPSDGLVRHVFHEGLSSGSQIGPDGGAAKAAASLPAWAKAPTWWCSDKLREACVPLAVRLRSAVCLLGRFPAPAGVDVDVEAGEVVLLSGANGSGKTTLLRLLAGLHRLHSGTADVLGYDLAVDRRGARRAIGLLGHETGCYDDLTVRENLRFAARAAGRAAKTSDA